jgi:hypothetical protein
MSSHWETPRPGILNLITIISFFISVLDVLGFLCGLSVALGFATLSWLLGPVGGLIGAFVGSVLVLAAFVRSFLSLVLFSAAWNTWAGLPTGRSHHLLWAWLTIILDLIDLLLTWGWNPATWWGLVYAVCLIYVMDLPEVRAYFEREVPGAPFKPGGFPDDAL